MASIKPKGTLERGVDPDLWRNTLSQIPSAYGRLVYLSSLRNLNTGRYEHYGLSLVYGERKSDEALRRSHTETFTNWLEFSLEEQKADLDLYLSELVGIKRTVIESWLQSAPYKNLVPTSAAKNEAELFVADLDALLGLLKNEYGVDVPDPDA